MTAPVITTSGIVQTNIPIADLIEEAFDYCQIAVEEEGVEPEEFQRAISAANLMLRDWQGQGFHLWQYTEAILFPQAGRTLYNLKPQDDTTTGNFFEERVVRCIRSDVVLFGFISISDPPPPDDDGSIFILMPVTYDCDGRAWSTSTDSMVGFRAGHYRPEIERIEWTQITEWEYHPSSIPTQNVDAPNDGQIWIYFKIKLDRIFAQMEDGDQIIIYQDGYQVDVERILDIRRLNQGGTTNENETPIKFDSHQEFERLPTKRSQGVPNVATFDRLVNGGCLRIWQSPQTDNDFFIRITAERTFEKFVNTGDTADFPQYWQDAFIFNLAERLCIKFRVPPDIYAAIKIKALETLNNALSYDNANYDMKIVINNRVGV